MLARPHRRERRRLADEVGQRPLGVGGAEQPLRGAFCERRRPRIAAHDAPVDVRLHPAGDHPAVLVGVVEQRDEHVVGDARLDQLEQRRLGPVGVPQRQRGVVVVSRLDLVDRAVHPRVAAVGVVEHRRHQQRAVQVVVEGPLGRGGAPGDRDAAQLAIPRRAGGPPRLLEHLVPRNLRREVARRPRLVDVADPDPHRDGRIGGGVERDVAGPRRAERPVEHRVEVDRVADARLGPPLQLIAAHDGYRPRLRAVDALADLGEHVRPRGAREREPHHCRPRRAGELGPDPVARERHRVVAGLRDLARVAVGGGERGRVARGHGARRGHERQIAGDHDPRAVEVRQREPAYVGVLPAVAAVVDRILPPVCERRVGPGLDHPERSRRADHRKTRAEASVARVDKRGRVGCRCRRHRERRRREHGEGQSNHPAGRPDCSNCCWVQLVDGGTDPGP